MGFESFSFGKKKEVSTLQSDEFTRLERIMEEKPEIVDFFEYCRDLELSPQDFNKSILDVGAGRSGFMRGADHFGLGKNIVSLDGYLGGTRYLDGEQKNRFVAATAEAMPFPDNSFEFVVSVASMPQYATYHLDNKADVESTISARLQEMWRVLKPGGWLKCSHVELGATNESEASSRAMELVLKKFEEEYAVKSKRSLMWDEDYRLNNMSGKEKNIGFGYLHLIQLKKPHKDALSKLAAAIGWQF